MSDNASRCFTIGELADYWTPDLTPEEVASIEAHVFDCAACARLLGEARQVSQAIGALVRSGAYLGAATESVLNQLARDGVRVRSYTVEPGETVQCAVWEDDEVVVARLRADLSGLRGVNAVLRDPSGDEKLRVERLPVKEGSTEILLAIPAAALRSVPAEPMRLTLEAEGDARAVAEYIFQHEGIHSRG